MKKQEEKFLRYLVNGDSQRVAYRRAYPASKASDRSVDKMASRLMKRVDMQSRYEKLKKERTKVIQEQTQRGVVADANEMFESLTNIIRSNILDIIEIEKDKKGFTHLNLREGCDGRAIQEVSVDRFGNIKVKMYPKTQAISILANINNLKEKDAQENNVVNELEIKFADGSTGDYAE